jgi:hypothetical protein
MAPEIAVETSPEILQFPRRTRLWPIDAGINSRWSVLKASDRSQCLVEFANSFSDLRPLLGIYLDGARASGPICGRGAHMIASLAGQFPFQGNAAKVPCSRGNNQGVSS